MDALAFLPATEMAARIHDGALSAREAVEASVRRIEALDGFLGAILIVCAGLGVVWIIGAFAVQNGSYRIRMEVQRSAILQRLNTALPPSGPLLNSLRRLDPFPQVAGPTADVAPPPRGIARP